MNSALKRAGVVSLRLLQLAQPTCSQFEPRRSLATLREQAIPEAQDPSMVYEPRFESPRPYPDLPTVNIRLQGYDFLPIQRYQSYVHKMALRMGARVVDSYAVAAQAQRIVHYKPNSTLVSEQIDLPLYDRVVRIDEIGGPQLQILANILRAHLPIGVQLTVKLHEKADEEARYIPDLMLKEKQEELKSLDNPIVRKNLGWE